MVLAEICNEMASLYKHIGKLFEVAGVADKAGLSKATVELSNVKNHRRPNLK